MKKIIERIDNYCQKIVQSEKDKWDSGMKNKYYSAYDLVEDIKVVLVRWERKYK